MKMLTLHQMAAQIKAALVEDGISQAEFARRIGMTEKHVSKVLTCDQTASVGTLDYWAFVLDREWSVALRKRETLRSE